MTGTTDTFDGTSDPIVMSLRDAVHPVNTTAGHQEIWLPAWDFVLTNHRTSQPTDIEPSYGDLDIKDPLTILGVDNISKVAWRTGAPADAVFELVGDYNSDDVVDNADEVLWQTTDGDDDGVTGADQGDYDAWFDHQGNSFAINGVS